MILLLAVALAGDTLPPWAEFSRFGERTRVVERVTIARDAASTPDHYVYRIIYTRSRDRVEAVSNASSTDSAACPAAREVVASMRDLAMPRAAPYGVRNSAGGVSILDGVTYRLRAPSDFTNGTLDILSNKYSPLATWVDHAFTVLEPCWPKSK